MNAKETDTSSQGKAPLEPLRWRFFRHRGFFKESRVISQQTEFKQTKGNSLAFFTASVPW
jgi:hypothetical protein